MEQTIVGKEQNRKSAMPGKTAEDLLCEAGKQQRIGRSMEDGTDDRGKRAEQKKRDAGKDSGGSVV